MFGVKSPKTPIFGALIFKLDIKTLKLAHYRNHCTDFNQISHSDMTTTTKYCPWVVHTCAQQIQDGGRPLSLKNHGHISATAWLIGAKFGKMTHIGSSKRVKISYFWKFKMAENNQLEKSKIVHLGFLKVRNFNCRSVSEGHSIDYPIPHVRTKRYCSFIDYALQNHQ